MPDNKMISTPNGKHYYYMTRRHENKEQQGEVCIPPSTIHDNVYRRLHHVAEKLSVGFSHDEETLAFFCWEVNYAGHKILWTHVGYTKKEKDT
jgi:hypothetical protein